MVKALVIHGPNLNMLGKREKSIYGDMDYDTLNTLLAEKGKQLGLQLSILQSNHEGELVDIIQKAPDQADVIVINPGAYTHTSVAIRDALLSVGLPVIEVHMSNIHKREPFRHHSYVSDIAIGSIIGFGPDSYLMALEAAVRISSLSGDDT
ncbi:3-dehydroquinate dehydratase II [hydrothermal vent metagenome]|uniref:3-dehydroquinate dehydratase n=1 Tax=hydrothermal vent metagenome TaxID=652676 RepID=A0A3B1C4D2_9ZZZZ